MMTIAPAHAKPPAQRRRTYSRDTWIESFESQFAILRSYLTGRALSTLGLVAWHEHGKQDVDPNKVDEALSEVVDRRLTR
jgi:hypothetical protein